MRKPLAFLPLIIIAVLGIFLAIGLTRDPSKIPSARIGKAVPSFDLPPLYADGQALSSRDLGVEGPVLVNFFASWCAPCRVEHPLLMQLKAEGVRIHGIAYKDDRPDAQRFLAQLGNPYDRIGADEKGKAGIEWGSTGVPETFVISATGQIVFQHQGPLTPEVVIETIKPLLQEGS